MFKSSFFIGITVLLAQRELQVLPVVSTKGCSHNASYTFYLVFFFFPIYSPSRSSVQPGTEPCRVSNPEQISVTSWLAASARFRGALIVGCSAVHYDDVQ